MKSYYLLAGQDFATATQFYDLTPHVVSSEAIYGTYGDESLKVNVDLTFGLQTSIYARSGRIWLAEYIGARPSFVGRLDGTKIQVAGLELTAIGRFGMLGDIPVTRNWSIDDFDQFRATSNDEYGTASLAPTLYVVDTNGRCFIGLKEGQTYANGTELGILTYPGLPGYTPTADQTTVFAWDCILPANWTVVFAWMSSPYLNQLASTLNFVTTGVLQQGVFLANPGVADRGAFYFRIFNSTGAPYNYLLNDGARYFRARAFRSTSNALNHITRQLSIAAVAGTAGPFTTTVAHGFQPGQRIYFAPNAALSEVATIATVPTSTTFTITANLLNGYAINTPVYVVNVYAQSVIRSAITDINAINPGVISSVTTNVSTGGQVDITDDQSIDEPYSQAIDRWVQRDNGRLKIDRETGLITYTADTSPMTVRLVLDDLTIERFISDVYNSVYATFKKSTNSTRQVSATATDAASIVKYGFTRRKAVAFDSTNASRADTFATEQTAITANPPPRFNFTVRSIRNLEGGKVDPSTVSSGSIGILEGLPLVLDTTVVDQIKTVKIERITVSNDASGTTIEVETTLPAPEQANYLANVPLERPAQVQDTYDPQTKPAHRPRDVSGKPVKP